MTLSNLAAIGSFISSIAVLVSLAYLNLQSRQITRNQQSLILHGRAQTATEWLEWTSQADFAELNLRGNDGDQSLNATEYLRYTNAVWATLLLYENNFLQHRAGALNEEQFAATLGSLKFQCTHPGFRAFWRQAHDAFETHFKAFVDKMLEATPPVPNSIVKNLDVWKALVADDAGKNQG